MNSGYRFSMPSSSLRRARRNTDTDNRSGSGKTKLVIAPDALVRRRVFSIGAQVAGVSTKAVNHQHDRLGWIMRLQKAQRRAVAAKFQALRLRTGQRDPNGTV